MKIRRPRHEKEQRKSSIVVWIFGAVFFSFMLSFFLGQGGILRLRELRANAEQMLMDNHRIAVENRRLLKEIHSLRKDPAAVEKIAREELHYVSPHDLVLLVPENH
jgi:cell division protein FtsB